MLGDLASDPQTKRDETAAEVNKWLEQFKTLMDKYAEDFGIPWDPEAFTLFSTPQMLWEAEILTPSLYSLVSSDPAKLDQFDDRLIWKAEQDVSGSVDVWLTPSDDPAILTVTTAEGTFGGNFPQSDKEEIFIGDPLYIEADLPGNLQSGETGFVTFRVGVKDSAGTITWLENVDLDISALFGSVGSATGITDANGEFETTAEKNNVGSNGVEITVKATDPIGRTGEETFTIPFLGDLVLELGFPNEGSFPHEISDHSMFAVRAGHIVSDGVVDWMFQPPGAAPEPPCLDETDVNGIEPTDISDLLYMVDYMFLPPGGAPAPVDCP